ncbi:MAG: ankyrin repeat domain-containing protein [Saprospiraceae bacterium]
MKRSEFLIAVIDKNYTLVSKAIESGENVNQCDSSGWTALHFAAQNVDVKMGQLLINNRASVDLQDKFGNSPLWRATFSSRGEGAFITLLLVNGAKRDLKNFSEVPPLDLAKNIDNYDVLQFYK